MIIEQDYNRAFEKAKEKVKHVITILPPLCRELNILGIGLYFISFIPFLYTILALSPSTFFSGMIWTALTSGFFDPSLFWLVYHLFIINICGIKLSSVWRPANFLTMCCVVVVLTSLFHMACLFLFTSIFTGYQMRSPACTLNCIVAIMLLGIRQNFFESKLVTPIPIYETTLKIPFKYFIHIYLCGSMIFAILFEARFDMRLFESTFFAWLYMRFYMIRELAETQGDQSSNFAFVSFFPSSIRGTIEPVSKLGLSLAVVFQPLVQCWIRPLHMTGKSKNLTIKWNRAIQNIDSEMEALMSGSGKEEGEREEKVLGKEEENVESVIVEPAAGKETKEEEKVEDPGQADRPPSQP